MVFKILGCLVKEKNNYKFLLAPLKTLTYSEDFLIKNTNVEFSYLLMRIPYYFLVLICQFVLKSRKGIHTSYDVVY